MTAANCFHPFRLFQCKKSLLLYPGVGYGKLSKLGVEGGGYHLVILAFAPRTKILLKLPMYVIIVIPFLH